MQRRGWGLTRASRIVIILLVVQPLGLGQVLGFAPVPIAGSTLGDPSQATDALDTVLSLAIPFDASRHSSAVLGEHGSWTIPSDPAPLPHRLLRAPPAA